MSGQGEKQLTLFQEDSPASLFPWLESKKEKKMTVTYGRKCSGLSENLRRIGLSVRTYLEPCTCRGNWWATEPDVGRVANGIPHRVDRLKCLGNAVVPQQAYPIFRAISELEATP